VLGKRYISQHESKFDFTPVSLGSQMGHPSEADSGTSNVGLGSESAGVVRALAPCVRPAAFGGLLDCVRLCIFNVGATTVDEAWTELGALLPEPEFQQIVKLLRVTNASMHPRIDMWVRGDLGASLVRELREMTRRRTPSFVRSLERTGRLKDHNQLVCGGWRFAIWQSWRDRRLQADTQPTRQIKEMAVPSVIKLASLNVNGFPSKREQVCEFIDKERITVCALQETLVSARQYPVCVPGFRTYARNWQDGFRGQAVLVHSSLPSYEVPHVKEKLPGYDHLLHVKVAHVPGLEGPSRSLHFVGVYFPSGGNMRANRSGCFVALRHLYNDILRNENGARIVVMGDFNASPLMCERRVGQVSLSRHRPVGSSVSRFPVRGAPASLDHMLVSPVAKVSCKRPRVLRNWAMSDHRPLVTTLWTRIPQSEGGTSSTSVRYDRRKLARHSFKLVNDNRWLVLEDLEATDQASLSDLASALSRTLKTISSDAGVRVDSGSAAPKAFFTRRLKKLLLEYRKESEAVADFLHFGQDVGDIALKRYLSAKAAYKVGLKTWRRGEKSKHYARIAEDFIIHNHKNVWARLKSQIDTWERGGVPPPVRNKAGALCVDSTSHLTAVKEHYQSLAQDDPDGTSRNERYWDEISLNYPRTEETLSGLNVPLSWKEIVVAIRGMNRDTAPGVDGMHVNLLKAMVKEECMLAAFGEEQEKHPDNSVRALPESKLPKSPLSPMGKALWKVLKAVWALENIPGEWSEVVIINLFKKGDPELLANYRGLSLISVSLKIIMVVMVHRLEKIMDKKLLSITRSQSRFRRNEEAIAQFLVMAESVHRRHLNGQPTFGLFIDLVKAYDRVPHGALYRVLEHCGIRGKFLNVVKAMYTSSKMRVRTCGKLAEPFDMWRGLRQGCPLSPLLFIIFIDHLLVDTRPSETGIAVPASKGRTSRGVPTPGRLCFDLDGGMYADDIVCFEETLDMMKQRCINIVEWGKKWGMNCNFSKSGIMLWSYDAGLRAAYNDTTFETAEGTFPKVSSYKYLGIEVSEDLPMFMGGDVKNLLQGKSTDALQYAKSLAAKGLTALSTLKPVLSDPACPIPLKSELIKAFVMSVMMYGSEFIGFNKKLAQPAQRVIDLAARWCVGLRKSNKMTSGLVLSVELGLPQMYEVYAVKRPTTH
jgi:exonuclease III